MTENYTSSYIITNTKTRRKRLLVLLLLFMSLVPNVYSQNILGKWALTEIEDTSINWTLDVIDRDLRITLSFFSDGTFSKIMFQYNPFDNFREELPQVNTLDHDFKKTKNSKVKFIGNYSMEKSSQLTLKTNRGNFEYDVKLNGDTLI